MKSFLLTVVIIASICFGTVSCKAKLHYYYNKATLVIAFTRSIMILWSLKKYKKLYRKYRPGSSIEELQKMEQYIILADKYNKSSAVKRLNTMQLTTPLIKQ
jgi:hypothetical protein